MDAPNVTVSVTMPEGADMEKASSLADDLLDRIGKVEGVQTVGAMMGSMMKGENDKLTLQITGDGPKGQIQ